MPGSSSLLSGVFYRIVYETDLPHLLHGAKSPEGRFHHSGQPALYLSPNPHAAGHAIAAYLHPDDPPRVLATLYLSRARIADLRHAATLQALGLNGSEAAAPWRQQRDLGQTATTWTASDAARASGADGMIYTARTTPTRWHLVLFRWNRPDGAQIAPKGQARPWHPGAA